MFDRRSNTHGLLDGRSRRGGAGLEACAGDVFFDIRLGAPNGPIIHSNNLPLQSSGTPRGRTPLPGAIQIPGVNVLPHPFWPEPILEVHPAGAGVHAVRTSVVPLPAAVWGGLALLAGIMVSSTLI